MEEGLKIIGWRMDGIRKLTAIDMTIAEKGLIPIKGKNRQGKSSVIDTIELLIKGNKVSNPEIITKGKDRAELFLKLTDYEIQRELGKYSKLKVKNTKTGIPESGEVQGFLNTFINELTFDPRPFRNKTAVEKFKFCLDLFRDKLEAKSKEKLGYGFAGIDTKLKTLEDERLLIGREVKKFGDLDKDVPEKVDRVDTQTILNQKKEIEARNKLLTNDFDKKKQAEIQEINNFNKAQRDKQKVIDDANDELESIVEKQTAKQTEIANHFNSIDDIRIEIEELKKKLAQKVLELSNAEAKSGELNKELSDLAEDVKTQEKVISELPQPEPEKPLINTISEPEYESTDELDLQLQNATAINQKADLYQKWLDKKTDKAQKQEEYEAYTGQIEVLREQKLEILRSIDTGVKGLEIRENGIYYNDTYSENWSDMEELRISAELCLAQLPKLRAVFIDGLESMDVDSQKDLAKWAEENDIQVIATIVASIPEDPNDLEAGVFYISEGTVITKEEK